MVHMAGERSDTDGNMARFAWSVAEAATWLVRSADDPSEMTDLQRAVVDWSISSASSGPNHEFNNVYLGQGEDRLHLAILRRGGLRVDLTLPNDEVIPIGSHDIILVFAGRNNQFVARRRAIEGLAPNFGLSVEMP